MIKDERNFLKYISSAVLWAGHILQIIEPFLTAFQFLHSIFRRLFEADPISIFNEIVNDKLSINFTRLLLLFSYLYFYVYCIKFDMRKSFNSLLVLSLFVPWVVNDAQNDNQKYPVESGEKQVLVQSDHSWNGTIYKSYPQGTPQLTVI